MTKLRHKSKFFQLSCVFHSSGHQINPGSVDRGVPQNIGQLHNVPANLIERSREQMPEVVGKNLRAFHTCLGAQRFHLPPDLAAGDRLSASGEKNLSGGGFLFPGVFQ